MKGNRFARIRKAVAVSCLAAVVAVTAAGCGAGVKNVKGVIATFDGNDVPADLAQFMIRYGQYAFETTSWDTLAKMYGDDTDFWNIDMTGSGTTMWDTLRQDRMEELKRLLLAEKHAEESGIGEADVKDAQKNITMTAQKFVSSLDRDTAEAFSASEDVVAEYLKLRTVQSMVEKKIADGVDTEVSDEEARQAHAVYAVFMKNGDYTPKNEDTAEETETESVYEEGTEAETENTEETKDPAKEEAERFLERLLNGDDFEEAYHELADSFRYTPVSENEGTFGEGDYYPDPAVVEEVLKTEEDGTVVGDVIEGDTAYYVVTVADAYDEEATAAKRESVIEDRKQQAISDRYAEWEKESSWEVKEDVLRRIKADRHFAAPETVETEFYPAETETEYAVMTEAETDGESAYETAGVFEDTTEGGNGE